MPIQLIKDPQTGQERQVYVAPKGMANEPKPAAKPPQKKDNGLFGLGLQPTDLFPTVGVPLQAFQTAVKGVTAGVQEFQRTGDFNKALTVGQQGAVQTLEGNRPLQTIGRMGYSVGRNTAQELSDFTLYDVPKALGLRDKSSTDFGGDAPFLGALPALPKAKSSGPAEDLAVGIAQFATAFVPVVGGLGLLSKAPGLAKVGQATQAAAKSYQAAKAAQVARLPAALQKPAQIAAAGGEAIASNVIGKNAAAGFIVDVAAFDQHEGRLTDLLDKAVTGTPLEGLAMDYLKSKPGDAGMEARLKNGVEGIFVGSTVEFVMRALRAAKSVKQLRNAPPEQQAATVAQARAAATDLQVEMTRQAYTRPDVGPELEVSTPRPDMQPPAYSAVEEVDPQGIAVNPQVFQFKEGGRLSKSGASGSLAESSNYNPELAGVVSVWRDADGQLGTPGQAYVVNGHNRLRLAKENEYPKVLVRYLDAATPEEARAVGALQNIAEGQGTPVDAAKFMRDTGRTPEDMAGEGINMSGPVIAKATPLVNLPQNLFDRVTTGKLDLAKAVALGSEPLDPQVINDVATEAIKRKWPAEKIVQAMQEAKFAQTETQEGDLLGLLGEEWASKTSNFNQLLDVRTEAFRAMREEMVALTSAANVKRTGFLEQAGNVIDVEGSRAAKDQASQSVAVFNRVAGYVGPVRDLLNEMAGQISGKRTAKAVVEENLPRLRQAIEEEINGPRLPMEEAAPAPAPPAAAPKAELPDTRGQGEFYHGAAKEIGQLDEGYYENANIYGQGFYVTDDLKTAGSYTKKNTKAVAKDGGTPSQVIYRVAEGQPVNFYDLDAPVAPSVREYLEQASEWSEATARALDEMDADPAIGLAKVMDEIRANSRSAGESRDTIQEVFEGIRETLEDEGYGGFTHVGGKLTKTGREHQVRIYWDAPNQLELEKYDPSPAATPAAAVPEPPAPKYTPEQRAESKALMDRAMATLPPEKRAAVQAEMEARGLASEADPGDGVRQYRELPAEVQQALAKEAVEDIRRVAGDDVAIRFNQAFELIQRPKEHGGGDKKILAGGRYDPIEDIIDLNGWAFATPVKGKTQASFHEAFHRVQFNFLTENELKALNSFWAQMKLGLADGSKSNRKLIEQQAVAFQKYAYARKEGIDPVAYMAGATEQELMGYRPTEGGVEMIKGGEKLAMDVTTKGLNVFDTLLDFIEKSNNYLRGRGWTSVKSIFEQAYSGDLAQTRQDLGNAYDAAGEGDMGRLNILDSIREMDTVPLGGADNRYRGVLYSEADEVPPVDVVPPNPDEMWARKLVDQMLSNREAIESGDLTVEELLANNVQKFESPSGATTYQPVQPPTMVEAYRAYSDLVTRPDATGIPVMSDERIITDTAAWLEKANYSSKAVLDNLKQLSGPLSAYRENLVALRAAALYVDSTNMQAGITANRWLNGQADEAADLGKLTAELVTAAAQQDRANRALESVTRPLGQLMRSTQIPRPDPASLPFDQLPPAKNIAEEIETALKVDEQELVADTIGSRISPEAQEAILTGRYDNPKVVEEFNALALNMAQGAVTPGFSQGFWKKFNSSLNLGTNGLMMYRSSQLLSSGITFWGNVINSALRTVELPLTQATGALMTGHPVRASRSLMIYGQYVSNLSNAFRMGVESFKVGRGLFDLDRSQVDFLDRLAQQDAQGELLGASPQAGEWNLNTMPWVSIQDKSNWAIAQKRLWQGLNLSTRLQVSADSAFKTLVGQSFEYVRNLQPGLDHAVRLGMDGNSKESWRFAQDYAQAAVDRNLKDLTLDGKTILDGVMDSPHAQTATRWATFTDDIWASMETRTMTRGMEIARAKGLKDEAAEEFAQEYINKQPDIPFFARTFSVMPRIWQLGLDSPMAPLFALIQPFNRTPGDIVKSVARKTPLAPLVDTWWRDVFSEDAMTRDRAVGDIATGAAAISLASIAMTHGRIEFTGGGPGNPDARRKWQEQDGKQPYSVRFRTGEDENGNPVFSDWISMRALDPYASLFGGLADYHELANKVTTEAKERLGGALILDLVSAVAAGQLQKSYYQGFTEVYEMAMGLGELDIAPNRRHPTARYVERLIASFLPYSSAMRAGRRIDDRIARDVPASNNPNLAMRLFEETASEIKNMLPGYSTELPPKRNWITGDPIFLSGVWGDQYLPTEAPWLSTLFQFNPASPFQIKGQPGDVVLREMGQLTGRGAGFIGPRATDFTDGGKLKGNRLNPYEYEQYILSVSRTPDQFGRTLLQALEEEVSSDLYQSNPQGQPSEQVISLRAAALNQVIATYLTLGRETFLSSPYGKRLVDNKDWAEGANRDVQYRLKYGQEIDPQSFIEGLR